MSDAHPPGGGLDPYHAAYLFRRAVEQEPGSIPANVEAAHAMFEALAEKDAMALVEAAAPALDTPELARLGIALSRMDSRPRVRARWIQALAERPMEGTRRVILESLRKDPSPRVQATCLSAWSALSEDIPLEFLRPFLSHPDARVRSNAVEALVERDPPGATGVLEVMLNDPAPRVAAAAALALWRRGKRTLTRILGREEGAAARVAFLWACGKAGRDRRLRELVEQAMEGGRDAERHIAAGALAAVSSPGRIPELVDWALRGDDHRLRTRLLEGCAAVDADATREALRAALDLDPMPGRERYQANALSAWKAMGSTIEVDRVVPLLEAQDARVRANAIELVEENVDASSLAPFLEKAFEAGRPREHSNAAVALWRRGSPAAMSRLIREVEDGQAGLSASAAYGLGRMGGAVAESTLRKALRNGDGATQRIALRFLAEAA